MDALFPTCLPFCLLDSDARLLLCAGTQQTQSVRDVTPSSYAPLSQSKSSGATATTDQATVGPVRPVNVRSHNP